MRGCAGLGGLGYARRPLKPRAHRLALQGEDGERALVHPIQRLAPDEALDALHTECEFPKRKRALGPQTACPQADQVLLQLVVRAVDDAQVLSTPALYGRLDDALAAASDEVERLYDDALAARCREPLPPGHRLVDLSLVG